MFKIKIMFSFIYVILTMFSQNNCVYKCFAMFSQI